MPKIELRSHHKDISDSDVRLPDNIWYSIGTPSERQAFSDTVRNVGNALKAGNFSLIGEEPDILCINCLNAKCPDSYGFKSPESARRRNVFSAVREDSRWLASRIGLNQGSVSLDDFYNTELALIDEWWNYKGIDDPNYIFKQN